MDSKNQFSTTNHAQLYLKYRPDTPSCIMDKILEYCSQENSATDVAIDIACGSGQSTRPLVNHFKKVSGIDISEAQILQASKNVPEANFTVGAAEDLKIIENESVDLVTICNGLHWTDQGMLFAEVKRILKPCGVFAAYVNTLYEHIFVENDALTEEVKSWDEQYLRPCRKRETIDVYQKHLTLDLPMNNVKRIELSHTKEWSLDHFIGYITSLSAYHNSVMIHPEKDIQHELKQRLCDALRKNNKGDDQLLKISWPVVIMLGRK